VVPGTESENSARESGSIATNSGSGLALVTELKPHGLGAGRRVDGVEEKSRQRFAIAAPGCSVWTSSCEGEAWLASGHDLIGHGLINRAGIEASGGRRR